jgi:hypothetical protein
VRRSEKSPQQVAETLYDATQQPEDASKKATHGAAEAAKNSHPTPLSTSEFQVPEMSDPDTRAGREPYAAGGVSAACDWPGSEVELSAVVEPTDRVTARPRIALLHKLAQLGARFGLDDVDRLPLVAVSSEDDELVIYAPPSPPRPPQVAPGPALR